MGWMPTSSLYAEMALRVWVIVYVVGRLSTVYRYLCNDYKSDNSYQKHRRFWLTIIVCGTLANAILEYTEKEKYSCGLFLFMCSWLFLMLSVLAATMSFANTQNETNNGEESVFIFFAFIISFTRHFSGIYFGAYVPNLDFLDFTEFVFLLTLAVSAILFKFFRFNKFTIWSITAAKNFAFYLSFVFDLAFILIGFSIFPVR